MRRSLGLVIVAVAVASAGACSLFVSTDALEGEGGDASIAGDASFVDAGADAVVDASTDAPNGPFCPTHPGHTLCADFDEGSATIGWSQTDVSNATFDLDTDASASPPASFRSNNPAFGAGQEGEARLVENIDLASATHVHVEFDVNVCDVSGLTGVGYIELFKLAFGPGFDEGGIELQISATGAVVLVNSTNLDYPFATPIVSGVWTHLAIDIVSGVTGSIQVVVGDPSSSPAVNVKKVDTTSEVDGSVYSAVIVGLYSNSSPACTSLFDNVLIDVN